MGETSRITVDHFRPVSDEEFWRFAFEWTNLYVSCDVCQQAKRDFFDPLLLRPDEAGFCFETYFIYDAHSGRIEPNPAASYCDRKRADLTWQVFDLNRDERCVSRRRTLQRMLRDQRNGELGAAREYPYRFLLALIS